MEKENLTLDDFLSRFQLLRPQVNREALNQRQAAVLIPVQIFVGDMHGLMPIRQRALRA